MNNNKFIDEFLHQDQDHPATFDGNENLLNFDSQTTTTTTTTNLAAKNMIDVDDLMNENDMVLPDTHAEHHQHQEGFDNEFGQETDVDAVDEAMLMSSPHSVSQEDDQMLGKEYQHFESKEVDFMEEEEHEHHSLPPHEPVDQFIEPELANKEFGSFNGQSEEQPSQRNLFGLPTEVLGEGGDDDNGKWAWVTDNVVELYKRIRLRPG